MKKLILPLFLIILSLNCQAMINMTFTGKVLRVEEKTIELESGTLIYTLLRNKLGSWNEHLIKKNQKSNFITLSVYADAIQDVKHVNK